MVSSLFGSCPGAYPRGSSQTAGKVEEADSGALFLDEIGDMTPDGQGRLLRFLNNRTCGRLGETREYRAEVRIIAATSRALEEDVAISLPLPALRARRRGERARGRPPSHLDGGGDHASMP